MATVPHSRIWDRAGGHLKRKPLLSCGLRPGGRPGSSLRQRSQAAALRCAAASCVHAPEDGAGCFCREPFSLFPVLEVKRQVVCVCPQGRMVLDPSMNFRVPPSLLLRLYLCENPPCSELHISACRFQSLPPFLSLPPDADTALWVWGPRGHDPGQALSVRLPVVAGWPQAPRTDVQEAACGTEGPSCVPIQLLTFGSKGNGGGLGLGLDFGPSCADQLGGVCTPSRPEPGLSTSPGRAGTLALPILSRAVWRNGVCKHD